MQRSTIHEVNLGKHAHRAGDLVHASASMLPAATTTDTPDRTTSLTAMSSAYRLSPPSAITTTAGLLRLAFTQSKPSMTCIVQIGQHSCSQWQENHGRSIDAHKCASSAEVGSMCVREQHCAMAEAQGSRGAHPLHRGKRRLHLLHFKVRGCRAKANPMPALPIME